MEKIYPSIVNSVLPNLNIYEYFIFFSFWICLSLEQLYF